jgi:phenylpropionate dioxygenase-like ring-hydroxylating dioxygenase large terminal subunit
MCSLTKADRLLVGGVEVDRAALLRQLDSGRTLPAEWYTDPDLLAREQRSIFAREWQYVGAASRLAQVGSFFTDVVAGVPIVVVRREDAIAAFVNVCPHRGFRVAEGEGFRSTLQCGYHGWTFGLDGRLKGAPRSDRERDFPREEIGLREVRLEAWGPLLFVNLDPDAAGLSETLGGVTDLVRERGFDLSAHPFRARRQWEIRSNWKVALDNNTECYHCATVHPGLRSEYHVDRDNYHVDAFTKSFAHLSPPKRADGPDAADFHLYYLWPNFMISARGADHFYTYRYVPVTAGTTLQVNDYFFPASYTDADLEEAIADIGQIMREDWRVFEGVQEGLASGVFGQGQLLRDEEWLLRQFQRLVVEAVAA